MSDLCIRPATPADVPTMLRFIHELAAFEKAEDQVKVTAADLERDGWGPAPRFEAVVAETADGAQALGFALFFHNYSTWEGRAGLYVEDLYVAEAARGLGVGQKLMAHLAAIAVARNCPRLELSVLDWNPARHFYARVGLFHKEEWLPYRLSGAALTTLAATAAGPVG